ncbi:MAG: phosphotriesterase-related protein [Chloroflexi bacterium]|nr:phosphotriesterase-related protein [Chloroflexota bacterium]
MAQVETVLGPIDGSELGFTLSHEHVFTCQSADNVWYPWMYDFDASRRVMLERLTAARAVGVQTLIDLTTPDLGRDVALMREMSELSGMQVVCATGMWRVAPMSFTNREPDEIAEIFVREIEVGIGDTDIRAGAIKVANDMEGVTEAYDTTIRGAARACKRTGTPISTHHWALLEVGRRQVEIFQEEGVPMDRVAIGHSADTTDVDYLEDLLKAGVYLSMDRYPGRPGRASWEERNASVKELIRRGYADKIMLGHDGTTPLLRVGQTEVPHDPTGPNGWTFLSTTAIPALLGDGLPQDTIDLMMIEVPRRFLTGEA